MNRDSVSSSLLASVGYDSDEQVLEVELQDGKVYQYIDIPERTYRDLLDADSLGRYFNQHIRGHSYVRIR
ncbi:KTSC domain-containing protein [Halogranum amylolyticum]|uniref:KTSC domain-containing protein n=1 Tax=Halogranum amylolyticum TaxID=660520 RepID=A0A1H8WM10_9EURY|nr:KTSC domain-containing protein [Halogranum amylolyticum]SEP28685.1 KTSC domain-containing protein [Halogranum amylolyticum]